MKTKTFNVLPSLPESIKALDELSTNMWFTWNWDAISMFVNMDADLWQRSHRNPKWILGNIANDKIEALGKNRNFVEEVRETYRELSSYLNSKDTWYARHASARDRDMSVAYFSMEYGIGEGLPIYSGGLGMLSGDHLKSSSDLGMPVIGVGLLYKKGYVKQELNRDCWQIESYPVNDWYNMPVQIVNGKDGKPLRVEVDLAGQNVKVGIWQVPVGRTSLYLLDTALPENPAWARQITEQLYGGDRENRIRQEIVLGIGGLRALEAMGMEPSVFHVNEGHSAFLLFERIRSYMVSRGLSFSQARELVWSTSVFTTHTPVMAGNERFDFNLVYKYFERYCGELGLTFNDFLDFGKDVPNANNFCMTVAAIKLSAFVNGVSKLHGQVSADMWKNMWPELPKYEIPIKGITNGVHSSSWISREHHDIYVKYLLDPKKKNDSFPDCCDWSRVREIPDEELWKTHLARKEKLVNLVRSHLRIQYQRWGADATVIEEAGRVLNPNYLTIGFARRFATYKRATLFMRDLNRLLEIVVDKDMPVQFVFAGKAHQADSQGKEYVRAVAKLSMDKRFKNRIVFVEDYNMNVARYMVQGVDVWMNNPIRPMEASGTSGMKAVINGVLNLSVLDGWWDEGYSPEVGWAIGGQNYNSDEERDYVESEALYNLIKKSVAPMYYDVEKDGVPHRWLKMMKACVGKLVPEFNTNRMLRDYYGQFYVRAHEAYKTFKDNKRLMEFSAWRRHLAENWSRVRVVIEPLPEGELRSGCKVPVSAMVWLGGLGPEEVEVQLHAGETEGGNEFISGTSYPMSQESRVGDAYLYKGELPCMRSGRQVFSVRVVGKNEDAVNVLMPLFIKWAEE